MGGIKWRERDGEPCRPWWPPHWNLILRFPATCSATVARAASEAMRRRTQAARVPRRRTRRRAYPGGRLVRPRRPPTPRTRNRPRDPRLSPGLRLRASSPAVGQSCTAQRGLRDVARLGTARVWPARSHLAALLRTMAASDAPAPADASQAQPAVRTSKTLRAASALKASVGGGHPSQRGHPRGRHYCAACAAHTGCRSTHTHTHTSAEQSPSASPVLAGAPA
jgi:hypothetical protein